MECQDSGSRAHVATFDSGLMCSAYVSRLLESIGLAFSVP